MGEGREKSMCIDLLAWGIKPMTLRFTADSLTIEHPDLSFRILGLSLSFSIFHFQPAASSTLFVTLEPLFQMADRRNTTLSISSVDFWGKEFENRKLLFLGYY